MSWLMKLLKRKKDTTVLSDPPTPDLPPVKPPKEPTVPPPKE